MMNIGSSNFNRLIGTWRTKGTIHTEQGNSILNGTDSYELILDGNYILHKADVTMGNEKSETFEIIKLNNSVEHVTMHYYNSKGETGVMKGSLAGDNFKIESDTLKFEGAINKENSELTGSWYMKTQHNQWVMFIDLKLTKQS